MNYYNEFNPESAAMLRQMMTDGLIPKGDIDERSITEVSPDDLRGYTQCQFFAGIGGWSFALQLAGWPEDRPVWTGSCPCQPFSSAGGQKGKADDRHLWPVWENLIKECQPATVFGEQVATAVAHGWLDDIYQGLEPEGYAIGSAVLPACSVGAPHKRGRLFFVGHSVKSGLERQWQHGELSNTERREVEKRHTWSSGSIAWYSDGKGRLSESGIPLLADGVQHRRPILHAIGNAIVPQVAAEFIKATM